MKRLLPRRTIDVVDRPSDSSAIATKDQIATSRTSTDERGITTESGDAGNRCQPELPLRRILVVNPLLPHYRRGVFRALDAHPDLDVVFLTDTSARDGIAVMSPSELSHHISMKALKFGPLDVYPGLICRLLFDGYDDVIISGDAKAVMAWPAAILARARGMRVHFWTIGWHRPEDGLKRIVRLAFYRLAHDLLLYGDVGRELGVRHGYPPGRMHVIGNSVVADSVVEEEPTVLPRKTDGEIWIGGVIRLSEAKRLELLIEAAVELGRRGIDTRVVLLGEGPLRGPLTELAIAHGVRLSLPGAVYDRGTLESFYQMLDVTVIPSAVGLAAIQSMEYGVPVVSDDSKFTQSPEWEAIRPGVTGELYESGSVQALADAIERQLVALKVQADVVRSECMVEIRNGWSPESQVERIVEALAR